MTRLVSACFFVLLAANIGAAQTRVFDVDPQQSAVAFTLGDVLHTVHGTFRLKSGAVNFDPSSGSAGGLLVVDATSGDSGSKSRDHRMNKDILESQRYPEITFAPRAIHGQVAPEGKSQVTVDGIFTLHGQPHPLSVNAAVDAHQGNAVVDLRFVVPYVFWGLKNPSTFILRVSDKVDIDVHAVGRIQPAASASDSSRPQ